jgi:hypothetical protein
MSANSCGNRHANPIPNMFNFADILHRRAKFIASTSFFKKGWCLAAYLSLLSLQVPDKQKMRRIMLLAPADFSAAAIKKQWAEVDTALARIENKNLNQSEVFADR